MLLFSLIPACQTKMAYDEAPDETYGFVHASRKLTVATVFPSIQINKSNDGVINPDSSDL